MFVKLKPGATLTFEELKKHLDGKIGKHEMPVALEIRAELPKTPVGKLSKKELKEEERAKARPRRREGATCRSDRGARGGSRSVTPRPRFRSHLLGEMTSLTPHRLLSARPV